MSQSFLDKTGLNYFWQKIVSKFVAKESGKGLSTNDYTTTEKQKLAGIANNANNYSLPTASSTTLGGVKVGSGLSISNGVLSVSGESGLKIIAQGTRTSRGSFSFSNSAKFVLISITYRLNYNTNGHVHLFVLANNVYASSTNYEAKLSSNGITLTLNAKSNMYESSFQSYDYIAIG